MISASTLDQRSAATTCKEKLISVEMLSKQLISHFCHHIAYDSISRSIEMQNEKIKMC